MQQTDVMTGRELAEVREPERMGSVMILTERDETPLWLAWETAKEAWLASKKRKNPKGNTVRAYELALRQFFAFAQGVPPWQVNPAHVQGWAMEMDERCSKATLSLRLAALSSFYRFVQRNYVMQRPDGSSVALWPADRANPFTVVERPHIEPYDRAVFPTTAELQQILNAINTQCLTGKRDFALLYTIATTCRRSSEVTNLRWGDLTQLKNGSWGFKYLYKGNKLRRAVLSPRAFQAICAYLEADGRPVAELTADSFLFVALHPERVQKLHPEMAVDPNRPISNHLANSILQKYARRAGVDRAKAHIHGLRHAGAHLRVEQMKAKGTGVNLIELRELLGHSSLAVTDIYVRTVHEEPEDPGGVAAAEALMPKGDRRRVRAPAGEQDRLM